MWRKHFTFILSILLSSLLGRSAVQADDQHPAPTSKPAIKLAPIPELVLPTTPGEHKLRFIGDVNGHRVEMAFLLYLPLDYAKNNDRHPLLMFLHGAGECGTDLAGVYVHGPMRLLHADGGNEVFRKTCPFIVLCPQCPPRGQRWDQPEMYDGAIAILDQVIKKARVDPDRVYCTGLSMGGKGTWYVAEDAPDRFAAIAPISSNAIRPELATQKLKDVAVWITTGDQDEYAASGSKVMFSALADTHREVRHYNVLNRGHDIWIPLYDSPQLYEWLLSQHRTHGKDPTVVASRFPTTSPVATIPLPTKPGHYLLSADLTIGAQPVRLDYSLYIPRTYSPGGNASPAMLYLHEQDAMGVNIHDDCLHGPDASLENRAGKIAGTFPFVVISPHLPPAFDWDSKGMPQTLDDLMTRVSAELHLDRNRLYVAGADNGATGAVTFASQFPEKVAAVAATMVRGQFKMEDATAASLKHVAFAAWVPQSNNELVTRLHALAGNATADWQLSPAPDFSPGTESPIFADPALYTWLLKPAHHSPARQSAQR